MDMILVWMASLEGTMIRCVRVTGIYAEPPGEERPHFSFWNTVIDRYEKIGDYFMWESRDEFEEMSVYETNKTMVERCRRLIPDWVPQSVPDN